MPTKKPRFLVTIEPDHHRALKVRIPIQGGHLFRFDGGHRSNLIPATIPI